MASSVKPAASGGATPTTLAEINVTPLVDVMLVLLIIFMISAPLMQQGIQVDLPKASGQAMNETPDQLVLVISKGRKITINGNDVPQGTLRPRLEAIAAAKPGVEVFIQGDEGVPYGFVAQVMAEVKRARIHRVGLVTDPAESGQRL